MKNQFCNLGLPIVYFSLFATFLWLCNCSKWIVSSEYIGQWETNNEEITVRTKVKSKPFCFTSDYASVKIIINADKTVSGHIGLAEFTNARLEKNQGLPWSKVVSPKYIIKCGSIGKIFSNDPLDQKEVEIWFAPINSDGVSISELRYTQGGAQFPMAHLLFMKVEN